MSTPAQQIPTLTTAVERRFYPRIVPQAPIFVAFNECEESLLLNIGENGLLVSTPTGLTSNFVARLSLSLNGLPKPVQVTARVLWTSAAGNLAGIQLLDLNEHDRHQIRKWGARESAQSWQPEPEHPSLVVAPSTASSETARTTFSFAEGAPVKTTRDIVPLAPPLIVRQRLTSIVERRVIWGLYFATACLVTVFFLRNDALGNLLSHSRTNRSQASAAAAATQETELTPQTPNLSSRAADSQPTLPAPIHESIIPKRANTTGASPHHDSAKRMEAPSEAASDDSPDDAQNDLSLAALPATTEAAPENSSDSPQSSAPAGVPKEATPKAETLASPDQPTPAQPLPNPTRASEAPSATSATIPSSTSSTPPSSPIVAPARPSISSDSDATIINMDPSRNQTLEVHLPSGHQASFLNLPGERVIESPTVTMHIQRSVLMPASGGGWFANRNKKVVVGELISRVDPQAAQIPTSPATSMRVKATVTKDGHIENVKLILGPPNLAPAVAKALREWRYQPTLVDNKPVETQCYVILQFHGRQYRAAKR
jgi:Gram-negative bacterial TonB protein C-terminal/PilZ domain